MIITHVENFLKNSVDKNDFVVYNGGINLKGKGKMMKYELYNNGGYLNTFNTYQAIREEMERLKRIHPEWKLEIISIN